MTKYVYMFSEGDASMRDLLGGKGANLAEMVGLGLPVPNGFTVTTEACNRYYSDQETIAPEIMDEITRSLSEMEELSGKVFGDPERPLLLSVRSGSRVSMPGMMDTVLNLGLNDAVAQGLVKLTGNDRFVYDSYRRFIMMFSDVVMGISRSFFEQAFEQVKKDRGVQDDLELDAHDLEHVVAKFKEIYLREKGEAFPQDVKDSWLCPLRPFSVHGIQSALFITARCIIFPLAGARPSTSRRWYTATWGIHREPESPSQEIRRQVRISSTVNIS